MPDLVRLESLTEGEVLFGDGLYLGVCITLFLLAGFGLGFFLWKRGQAQIADLEAENRAASNQLALLGEELERERRLVEQPAEGGD